MHLISDLQTRALDADTAILESLLVYVEGLKRSQNAMTNAQGGEC